MTGNRTIVPAIFRAIVLLILSVLVGSCGEDSIAPLRECTEPGVAHVLFRGRFVRRLRLLGRELYAVSGTEGVAMKRLDSREPWRELGPRLPEQASAYPFFYGPGDIAAVANPPLLFLSVVRDSVGRAPLLVSQVESGAPDWLPRSLGISGKAVASLVTLDDSTLVAGTYNYGLYRSTDRGQTWTSPTSRFSAMELFLTSCPSGLYLHGQGSSFGPSLSVSRDRGTTWVTFPIPAELTHAADASVRAVAELTPGGAELVAGITIPRGGMIARFTPATGIWTRLLAVPAPPVVAVDPGERARIVVAADSLYVSMDGGTSWRGVVGSGSGYFSDLQVSWADNEAFMIDGMAEVTPVVCVALPRDEASGR